MAPPLSFEAIDQLNPQSSVPSFSTDGRAVAGFEDGQFPALFAAVGDLSAAATDAATSTATDSAGSVAIINPNRSVRSTSSRVAAAFRQRIRQAYLVLPIQINPLRAQSRSDGLRHFQ
jgi:hypothetical protein